MADKTEMLMQTLDRYQVRYNAGRSGEQSISCPNKDVHQDRNPSCSLNLTRGVLYCQACGLSGDAYSVLMSIEGITFSQATTQLGKPLQATESDWLIL